MCASGPSRLDSGWGTGERDASSRQRMRLVMPEISRSSSPLEFSDIGLARSVSAVASVKSIRGASGNSDSNGDVATEQGVSWLPGAEKTLGWYPDIGGVVVGRICGAAWLSWLVDNCEVESVDTVVGTVGAETERM